MVYSHRCGLAIVLAAALTSSLSAQSESKGLPPGSPRTRAIETLEWWNHVGGKLIAMAKDFPEEKYDFRVQENQRTFAENILHVASVDFDVTSRISGTRLGPDFGAEGHSPTRRSFRTKTDAVKLLEDAVAAGAKVIQQQGDAGLDKTISFAWETGSHVSHVSYAWMSAIEHTAEHFGQLAVYYRASGLVPPESRPRSHTDSGR